jgi:Ras-related GTP-binding protein C/D
MRYLQDLPDADIPPNEVQPRYHTGRLPNSKAGDGKPRLLLMGQRRYAVLLPSVGYTFRH